MISFDIILFGLMIVSVLTGLTTEAVKKLLTENKIKYQANTLAGAVALALSFLVGIAYVILADVAVTSHVFVYFITFAFMGWLCSMVGYDKVIQTVSQFKSPRKED